MVLRIVMEKPDLMLQDLKVQRVLKNLHGRSAILDVHATDSKNMEYDIEIQKEDAGAGTKRARHNSSLLDAHILKVGEDPDDMNFEELAKKARYFKRSEEGVAAMCKMMEDMRKEAADETVKEMAIRMLRAGKMTLEDIADYTELSLEEVKELEKQSIQPA